MTRIELKETTKQCAICEKGFQYRAGLGRRRWTRQQTCSLSCRYQHQSLLSRGPRRTKYCRRCGRVFYVLPSGARIQCCSVQCAADLRRKNGLPEGKILNTGYHGISRNGVIQLEHRWKMEQELNRPLRPGEVVHHRNGNRMDNRIENLELFPSHAEHMRQRHNPRDRHA